jgi:Xaa-Pro dipeptidase
VDERIRVERLLDARRRAQGLFEVVEARDLVRPGITERTLANEIRDIAKNEFGVTRHWHKRVLCDALPEIWEAGRTYFHDHTDVTGEELFDHVVALSEAAGWRFGGVIAGHLVGEFPHEKIAGEEIDSHVAPGSHLPMRRDHRSGRRCHRILEMHLVEQDGRYGGFHEELLDI